MKNGIIEDSSIFKDLFGFETLTTPLFYQPLRLISESDYDKMIQSNLYLSELNKTVEGIEMLSTLKKVIASTPNLENETDEVQIILPGEQTSISVEFSGVEVKTNIVKPTLNFIFNHLGNYHCTTSITFKADLRRSCVDETTKKVREDLLVTLLKNIEEEGLDFCDYMKIRPTTTTIGKIISMLLPGQKASVISDITTFIKSCVKDTNKEQLNPNIFEVESDLITYYYNSKNYGPRHEGTTLGNSCMSKSGNYEQIKFYANNPDAVKLIAFIRNKKLEGRALLWKNVNGIYIVDRIYTIDNEVATKMAQYCQIKGYKTCYSSNVHSYGLTRAEASDVIVQLNQLDNSDYQPYFDSMKYIDIVNGLICPDKTALANYNKSLKRDFVTLYLNNYVMGGMRRPTNDWNGCEETYPLQVGTQTQHAVLRDAEGRPLNNFKDVVVVNRPFKGLVSRHRVVDLYPSKDTIISSIVRSMIKQYNCIRVILTITDKLEFKLADRKDTLYSSFHKSHILKEESVFNKRINSFILNKAYTHPEFQSKIKLLKLKRIYSGKLVHVTPEGILYLQEQFKLLPGKISLSSIRPSRTFLVRANNITATSIVLKDIPVPLKYIKTIKK